MNLRTAMNSLLAISGYRLINRHNYEALHLDPRYRAGKRWHKSSAPKELIEYVFENIKYSNSQIQQDLFAGWVIERASTQGILNPSSGRYFVEFGATNGFQLSNTFFLEMYKNWEGLVCEPAKIWHQELRRVRKCRVDLRCVYSRSDEYLLFTQADDPELGTLTHFREVDNHANSRQSGESYLVETISLNDLLDFHQAPSFIDFMSIDTEGSEFEILQSLDFDRFTFGVITVEHNFTPSRESIYDLLTNLGYNRVLTEVSEQDDWYVNSELSIIFSSPLNLR
jgi:FkbM family methyltransferase